MGYETGAGAALSISAGVPASQDSTGYAALTYTEIGGIEKLGAIGASFAKVEFQPLKGAKQKLKGSADYGTLSPSLALDSTDAGQTLLSTASANETNALYAFKAVLQGGGIRYFQGRSFGMPETIDGADSMAMANPTIEICTKIVKV